jgi:tetratricopeptide (TPR) repeat protein
MIKFGDSMNIFGTDAALPTADPHKLLKLCKDFALRAQKEGEAGKLDVTDSSVECVLVHVAALGCSVLQARVESEPAVAVEIEATAADGLSTLATLKKDNDFVARAEELARVGCVVEAVFTSIAPAPRDLLLLRGYPGLGKSAAAKQGLRLMQNSYASASCCTDVHVPSIIRGRGAAAVQEDLVRWGRDIGSKIGVGPATAPEAVLPLLKAFLEQSRYVVLVDDADEAGLQEALKHLPPSQLRCSLLVTSQMLKKDDLQRLVSDAESSVAAGHGSIIDVCALQPFTPDECMQLTQSLCPVASHTPLYAHDSQLKGVYEELARLPLAVRFFGVWLHGRYRAEMDRARQSAAAAAIAFDEAAAGAAVAAGLLVEWSSASGSVVLAAGAEHSRGLQGTVKLALHFLASHPLAAECRQLLALLALCPPVRTPWSLFDGGGVDQAALMVIGRRVVVEGQTIGHVTVAERNCRIPKLKLAAVAVSDDVKEGGKVEVRLSDEKVIKVKASDLVFEGDAAAVEMEGLWLLPRRLDNRAEGRVMRQHDDGSVTVMFQRPHEGCHVRLQGPTLEADLNGCFGYVFGAFDGATQRWPVRVTLPTNEVKDVLLRAENLVCSGKVMTGDGNGGLKAVPAFASGWLTKLRPGAEVMRFKQEDVKGTRAEGVLVGVTDALGEVAVVLGSSGLVEVEEGSGLFGMHQLLQKAVRAELGDTHDDAMAALLEARCGCMGDEYRIDHRMYGVMREVVGAAGRVLDGIKAAAAQRAVWVCGMRVRIRQIAQTVLGGQSLEIDAYHHALDADLSALGVERGRPVAAEYRAMDWWRKCCRGSKLSRQELIRDVEDAESSASDAATTWDCRATLGKARLVTGSLMTDRGKYDKAIKIFYGALRIQEATLGEMHADTAATICSMGASYGYKGQLDRAIELYERALRIQEATLGKMHADTARTISSMGAAYSNKGRHDRAIELFQRAQRIQEATLGEMHADRATTITNIGASYNKKGQYDSAIEFYERALRIQEATLGEMHADTAKTISNMGVSYGNKGRHDRAIEFFQRALRIQEASLGEMHADTVGTICSMGASYGEKGQLDRAIELYERALRIQEATLGEIHASTARTISSMGVSYGNKGQYDRAIASTERALHICSQVLGPHHPQTLQTQQNLANIRSDAARAGSGRGRR